MALNWSCEKVKDWEKMSDEERSVMDSVIWLTMGVGIRRITEKNYQEFYARTHLAETLHGAMMQKGGKERPMTLEDIKRYIGLSTNASTLTRSQFNKRQLNRFYEGVQEYGEK